MCYDVNLWLMGHVVYIEIMTLLNCYLKHKEENPGGMSVYILHII